MAGAIWGSSFAVIKVGLESVDPIFFALLRFALGGAIMALAMLIMGRFDRRLLTSRPIIVLSAVNAAAFALQNVGLTMTTATNAALLININVGIVAILAAVMLKETITSRTIYGLGIGLVGVIVISTGGDLASVLRDSSLGDLLVFSAGALWAFYIVYMKRTLEHEKDVLMISTAVIIGSAAFLFPLTLLMADSTSVPASGLWTVLYTGIVCTALAYLIHNVGLKRVRATDSAIILLVEPVFGVLFAILLLQEWPTVSTLAGGALVLLSIGVVSRRVT
jgi:drug/metabolite transporter (DMT)-like permease